MTSTTFVGSDGATWSYPAVIQDTTTQPSHYLYPEPASTASLHHILQTQNGEPSPAKITKHAPWTAVGGMQEAMAQRSTGQLSPSMLNPTAAFLPQFGAGSLSRGFTAAAGIAIPDFGDAWREGSFQQQLDSFISPISPLSTSSSTSSSYSDSYFPAYDLSSAALPFSALYAPIPGAYAPTSVPTQSIDLPDVLHLLPPPLKRMTSMPEVKTVAPATPTGARKPKTAVRTDEKLFVCPDLTCDKVSRPSLPVRLVQFTDFLKFEICFARRPGLFPLSRYETSLVTASWL